MGKKKKEVSGQTETLENNALTLNYRVNLKCKTNKQKELVNAIKNNQIIFVEGVFGVGKTFVINSMALELLQEPDNNIEKIVMVIPTCTNSSFSVGHLPGNLEEKLYNFTLNEIDAMKKILKKSNNLKPDLIIDKLIKDGKIEIRPISFLRGASIENSFVCVSEAEQFTKEDLFLILTRFESGKMVISGDVLQTDRREVRGGNSGLVHAIERLDGIKDVGIVKFSEEDIVRNDILLDIYKKWK